MNRSTLAIAYTLVVPALRRSLDRAPDTVVVLILTTLTGTSVVFGRTPPAAIEALAPGWLGLLWGVLMAASSALALIGVFWREELIGWSLELGARITLGAMLGLYAVAIALYAQSPGAVVTVGLTAAFAISSVWRALVLYRRISAGRKYLQLTIEDAHEHERDRP